MPAQDLSLDMLELTEIPAYEAFHKQTLELYCKLCGYGNSKVAHYLCAHVDQEQLMYAIKNPCWYCMHFRGGDFGISKFIYFQSCLVHYALASLTC